MAAEVLIRKARSAVLTSVRRLRSSLVRVKTALSGSDVRYGQNVRIGRHATIKTTDGGRIVIGDGVEIDDFTFLYAKAGVLSIGNNGYVGIGSHLVATESVTIGSNALIAAYCIIRDNNHGMAVGLPMTSQKQVSSPVSIGDDVWLAAHVVVTAGASIGSGAVIGANAVVTRDVDEFVVAGGVPARAIRTRKSALEGAA